MTRFELLLLLLTLFAAVILTIRSRWFDRLLDWTFKRTAPKPVTPPSDTTPPQA